VSGAASYRVKLGERHEQPGVGHQHELGHAAITAEAAAA
jgi:hypothetical protein